MEEEVTKLTLTEKVNEITELAESIVDDIQKNFETYIEAVDKLQALGLEPKLDDFIYSTLHLRMVQEKPTVKDRLILD